MMTAPGQVARSGSPGTDVLRGGSWNNNSNNARAANRNRNEPTNRNDNNGFRVVVASAHVRLPLLLVAFMLAWVWRRCAPPRKTVPEMCARYGGCTEAKGEEQRRDCLVRAQARKGRATQGIASAGRIQKTGHSLVAKPTMPALWSA